MIMTPKGNYTHAVSADATGGTSKLTWNQTCSIEMTIFFAVIVITIMKQAAFCCCLQLGKPFSFCQKARFLVAPITHHQKLFFFWNSKRSKATQPFLHSFIFRHTSVLISVHCPRHKKGKVIRQGSAHVHWPKYGSVNWFATHQRLRSLLIDVWEFSQPVFWAQDWSFAKVNCNKCDDVPRTLT